VTSVAGDGIMSVFGLVSGIQPPEWRRSTVGIRGRDPVAQIDVYAVYTLDEAVLVTRSTST
jgi:hypothetical protein